LDFPNLNFFRVEQESLKKSGFAEPDIFLGLKRNIDFSHQGAG
jgi:hypothetical protein